MRVIAGEVKGFKLKVPQRQTTRPATELVRGALFSMIEVMAVDWIEVLDLFSGSGSLGIEALSRGAEWVDFVENEPKCCDIIRHNLDRTHFTAKARIFCIDVNRAIVTLRKEYNVILVDPPYREPNLNQLVAKLSVSNLVGRKTTLAITHSPRQELGSEYGTLSLVKERRHGDSIISIYQKEAL
jgi:16S rRNA (guanine(966)-N(2))-methyltransferase RsmD